MSRRFINYLALALSATLLPGVLAQAPAPGTNDFRKVVLDQDVLDPMELDISKDGRVFFIERGGLVKIWKPDTKSSVVAATLKVFGNYNVGVERSAEIGGWEDGLLGLHLAPDFETSHELYLYYSPVGIDVNRLSRFKLNGDQLDLASEKIIIDVPVQRDVCCHAGGGLEFDSQGNIYISTGDNTNPFASDGYAPIDWQPGRYGWDAARSAGNANDLRGKILRLTPKREGGYAIPAGNLFPSDGSKGRPEIYTMGHRNPFRIHVDSATGWLYWGDVGPDARAQDFARGPAGFDEVNQARTAGNYGWPFFMAANRPYHAYDFATKTPGPAFDPAKPVNLSPNNTGPKELPPAQPAWLAYPYTPSARYPELGSGGRSAMAGPVYHFNADAKSPHKLPKRYDKSLFIYEWMRNWIKEVRLDDRGQVQKINPFADGVKLIRPTDLEIGPDGCLYVIEFGTGWEKNADSQIVRLEYIGPP